MWMSSKEIEQDFVLCVLLRDSHSSHLPLQLQGPKGQTLLYSKTGCAMMLASRRVEVDWVYLIC